MSREAQILARIREVTAEIQQLREEDDSHPDRFHRLLARADPSSPAPERDRSGRG